MTVHAFIDESRRGHTYLMAVVLVTPPQLTPLRRQMRQLLLPGERELHLYKQGDGRRRKLVRQVAALEAEAIIYQQRCASSDEPARQACVSHLTCDLLSRGAHRMVLDSRNTRNGDNRDKHDRTTINYALKARGQGAPLTYEHLDSQLEPLLWIADVVGWCWGAGGDWRKSIDALVLDAVNLD